jgi:hypothetical protein
MRQTRRSFHICLMVSVILQTHSSGSMRRSMPPRPTPSTCIMADRVRLHSPIQTGSSPSSSTLLVTLSVPMVESTMSTLPTSRFSMILLCGCGGTIGRMLLGISLHQATPHKCSNIGLSVKGSKERLMASALTPTMRQPPCKHIRSMERRHGCHW